MTVAKGVLQADKSYLYTCGRCKGRGVHQGAICTDCYGCDAALIIPAMKNGAQGQRYYALLKAFLSVQGKAMVDEAIAIRDAQSKLVVVDVAWISLKFELNFKATCEWLSETGIIASGIYEHAKDSGLKVKDIYAAARTKYESVGQD